jgi:hypothetical protein
MKKMIFVLIFVFFLIPIAHASSIGAALIVPPEKNTSLTIYYNPSNPVAGDYIYIYADYQSNSTEVLNATVNITIGGATYLMNYDPSHSAYEHTYYSSKSTILPIKVSAKKISYKRAEKDYSIRINNPTANGGAPKSIITIVSNNETIIQPGVPAGGNITIPISIAPQSFQYLILTAAQQIAYGNIYMATDSCSIHNLPKALVLYDCISIKLKNIKPEQYDGNLLYFKVSKYWIKNENINISKIAILHVHNKTQERLNVTRANESNNT